MPTLKERLSNPFNLATLENRYGSLDYVGPVMHPKYDNLVYVYYQAKPPKGYSNFFGLTFINGTVYIMGITGDELQDYQWHMSISCPECKETIVSLGVHDYQECSCNKSMVDGGSRYLRCYTNAKLTKINTITLELKS